MVFSETDRDLRQSSLDNCRRRRGGHCIVRSRDLFFFFSLSLCLLSSFLSSNGAGEGKRAAKERKPTAAAAEEEGRSLLGPGSYPPRCSSKCGDCTPCRPVHVAVPPGTPVLTEYYPEAWRCKCGGRLYMP
ncbi:unnamed protein product [Spirodela intermedia]|uniref:Epidermal patterning factor-like protein n=1 Tax=Spirodela intermedia TaxID=51605 RepID=A0A7I8IGC9_SPIIN|nr:unnamed protein product [Spirodela intermedia]CAA6656950.1 unnamed protein product [Spirodela intermedia]